MNAGPRMVKVLYELAKTKDAPAIDGYYILKYGTVFRWLSISLLCLFSILFAVSTVEYFAEKGDWTLIDYLIPIFFQLLTIYMVYESFKIKFKYNDSEVISYFGMKSKAVFKITEISFFTYDEINYQLCVYTSDDQMFSVSPLLDGGLNSFIKFLQSHKIQQREVTE